MPNEKYKKFTRNDSSRPLIFDVGWKELFCYPFTCTLKTSYGCGGYTLTGRETGSDKPGRAKTICQDDFILGILRAILSVAVTPRGGADCDDPCHLSWYFCRKTAALKNGRTHHPCLRKNRGRLLWCPWEDTFLYQRNVSHTFVLKLLLSER